MSRIVLLGYGTVGRCALPLFVENALVPPQDILVLDQIPEPAEFAPFKLSGVRYFSRKVTPTNLGDVLGEFARAGDILVNLSVSVSCLAVADWCQQNGVAYLDTAFEPWGDNLYGDAQKPSERTMYWEHFSARRHARAKWKSRGPSAVFGHGANPGLVSHFAKAALAELARSVAGSRFTMPANRREWGMLAKELGVKVMHISERDTQITSAPKQVDEFVNTWSIFSFIEESCRPVEIGWGTHEKARPVGALDHQEGNRNCIYVPVPSTQFLIKSWVPVGGAIEGISLPHSECVTISDYFTLDLQEGGHYRPTVSYCYLPCDSAMASLHEVRMNNWRIPQQHRILANEIVDGADELGVLVLGSPHGSWWFGSRLTIHETRTIAKDTNPTAMQVAAGVLGAARWILDNPSEGYCESEDLPFEQILQYARPYLGSLISTKTEWHPFRDELRLFDDVLLDRDDPWQFNNFIVNPGFRGAR